MTHKQLIDILYDCNFNCFGVNFEFYLQEKGDGWLLQAGAYLPCIDSGKTELMKGGKYYISSHSVKSEVVFKALQACLAFVEHEAREGFTYQGTRIVFPHLDVDELKEFVDNSKFTQRS